jgi:hypothetical protein
MQTSEIQFDNLVDPEKPARWVFGRKNRRWYRRERALHSSLYLILFCFYLVLSHGSVLCRERTHPEPSDNVNSRETNEKMKWKMKNFTNSGNFEHFSEFFSHFFAKSRDILSFPEHFWQNFIKISPKNRKIHQKTRMKNEISFSFRQKFGRVFAEILRSERCKRMRIL